MLTLWNLILVLSIVQAQVLIRSCESGMVFDSHGFIFRPQSTLFSAPSRGINLWGHSKNTSENSSY